MSRHIRHPKSAIHELLKRRVLAVEPLHSRIMMAADVDITDAGIVRIWGGNQADAAVVVADTQQVVVAIGDGRSAARHRFDANRVTNIEFYGRDGNDIFINASSVPSKAWGYEGDDVLIGGTSGDLLHGGVGNDAIDGREGNDFLEGDFGNDKIKGGAGADTLRGWTGDDRIEAGNGDDYVLAGDGNDVVLGGSGNDRLEGEGGMDAVDGQDGADAILGGSGTDFLLGGTGDDLIFGQDATDFIFGQDGNDHLLGGDGDDLVEGGLGNDSIWGESGDDLLLGGSGVDVLYGQLGNDRLDGGNDYDYLYGQDGNDTLYDDFGGAYRDLGAGSNWTANGHMLGSVANRQTGFTAIDVLANRDLMNALAAEQRYAPVANQLVNFYRSDPLLRDGYIWDRVGDPSLYAQLRGMRPGDPLPSNLPGKYLFAS